MAKKSNKSASAVETKVEEVVGETGASQVLADEYESAEEIAANEVGETMEQQDSSLTALMQNLQESVEREQQEVEVPTKPAAPAVKVEKNQGVGQFVRRLIAEGMSNKDILKEVHDAYGNTQTTYACVAWYRNKMKKANQQAKVTSAVGTVEEFLNKETTEEEPSANS